MDPPHLDGLGLSSKFSEHTKSLLSSQNIDTITEAGLSVGKYGWGKIFVRYKIGNKILDVVKGGGYR